MGYLQKGRRRGYFQTIPRPLW